MTTNLLIIILIIVVVGFVMYSRRDNFTVGQQCQIDEDCPGDNFCYMGQCWGYWKGYPMPWSTCRNPYCGSTDPYATCNAGQNKCSPYCKCTLNRRPGGSIDSDCFPKCGTPCSNNDNCPPGCPACRHGICSAPEPDRPVM